MSKLAPLAYIRIKILDLKQTDMAAAMNVSPMAWSRWESGQRSAPLDELRPVLRRMCEARSLPWNDSWLFELPVCNACIGDGRCGVGCARVVAASAAVRGGDKAGGAAMLAGMGECRGDVHLSGPPVVLASAANEPQVNGLNKGKGPGDFPRDFSSDFPSLPAQVAS